MKTISYSNIMHDVYKMTVVIPVFNEVDNLDRIESVFKKFFSSTSVKCKVLFVDDGSTDGSFDKIDRICSNNKSFEYIKFKQNNGLSAAIKAGIDYCSTELFAYIDADLQTSPNDLTLLLEHINEYDAVVGFRKKRKDTLNKKVQSFIGNSIRRALINDGIIDTCCPLKIIKTKQVKHLPFFKGMHRFIPALIQLQGGTVKQIEVSHAERIAGKSKFNVLNRSIGPLYDAFAYRWMRKRNISYALEKKQLTDQTCDD